MPITTEVYTPSEWKNTTLDLNKSGLLSTLRITYLLDLDTMFTHMNNCMYSAIMRRNIYTIDDQGGQLHELKCNCFPHNNSGGIWNSIL